MQFIWNDDFSISVRMEDNAVVISANKAGLLSLARHLETLANEGGHFHLDQYNSLEEGSLELIVDNIEE